MNNLCASPTFIWSVNKVLGRGATSVVYEGWHKIKGARVAVKTFNNMSRLLPYDVQMREFEMLHKVNHKNIISLLAFEEELQTRNRVLVMELCTGGSLYSILEDPENSHGLKEDEFLLFLEHVTAGMKQLRDNNIIHRDLKPGNIMRFIGEDGKSIYKLTDFGAARELEDDQKFMSLYGTEEYLHPDMYGKAVLKRCNNKSFGATVDLWSIGVTLYHVATGELPFRPFGGRKSKETMYEITTKKKSGVLSGVQTSENSAIAWSTKLPDTICLSQGLKDLLTPILAGLLECNSDKALKFDDFFKECKELLCKIKLDVFCSHTCSFSKIYIDSHEKFAKFQELIAIQTDIRASDQYIFFDDKVFDVNPTMEVKTYPKTSCSKPFILLSKSLSSFSKLNPSIIPCFPVFENEYNADSDAQACKLAVATAYYIERKIEELCQSQLLFHHMVQIISNELQNKYIHLKDHFEDIKLKCQFSSQSVNFWDSSHLVLEKLFSHICDSEKNKSSLNFSLEEKKNSCTAILDSLNDLEASLKKNENLINAKEFITWNSLLGCRIEDNCKHYLLTAIVDMKEIYTHSEKGKTRRNMPFNDVQLHSLEKVRLKDHTLKIQTRLQKHCFTNCSDIHSRFHEWYTVAQQLSLQLERLEKQTAETKDAIYIFKDSLFQAQNEYEKRMKEVMLNAEQHLSSSSNQEFPLNMNESNKLTKTIKKEFKQNLDKLSHMLSNTWETIQDDEAMLKEFSKITTNDCLFSDIEFHP